MSNLTHIDGSYPYYTAVPYSSNNHGAFNPYHRSADQLHPRHNKQDSYLRLKTILANQLLAGNVLDVPFYRHGVSLEGGTEVITQSEMSYELTQDLGAGAAVFSFSNPSSRDRVASGKFVWRISLPTWEQYQASNVQVVCAEVQVATKVMDSTFGTMIRNDPRIICQALATSLQLGIKINITLAKYPMLECMRSLVNVATVPKDIIYVGTSNKGQQQVLTILDSRTFLPKYTCSPIRPPV